MFRRRMAVIALLALAGSGSFIAPRPATAQSAPAPLASSTFDANADGWTAFYDVEGVLRAPTYVGTGGNPGGYLTFTDQMENAQWYWRAPAAFYGDVSAAYGLTFEFDLNQSDTSDQFPISFPDVILKGNGLTLTFNTIANPELTWTRYQLVLEQGSGWRNATTGALATESELRSVLGNLTEISIRGEYHRGVDTGGLDNVILGGPPPTQKVFLPLVRR